MCTRVDIWDSTVGEELECARESDNPADCYTVAMKKDGETVGDIQQKMPRLCALLLERNSMIHCTYNDCSARNSA